jgi:hypothetical protein
MRSVVMRRTPVIPFAIVVAVRVGRFSCRGKPIHNAVGLRGLGKSPKNLSFHIVKTYSVTLNIFETHFLCYSNSHVNCSWYDPKV